MLYWTTNLPYNLRNICLLPCFALKCRGLSASSSSLPPSSLPSSSSSFWPLPPKNCVVTKFSAFRFFLQNRSRAVSRKWVPDPFLGEPDASDAADALSRTRNRMRKSARTKKMVLLRFKIDRWRTSFSCSS